jgi:heme-degrading protein
MHFAEGKAFARPTLRQTTEALGALEKTRPDRYFGIMSMYPGKVYLVGGGVPLAVNGQIVGAVGIAGLPQGVDEMAARAGMRPGTNTARADGRPRRDATVYNGLFQVRRPRPRRHRGKPCGNSRRRR